MKGYRETELPFYSDFFCTLKNVLVSNPNAVVCNPVIPRACVVSGSAVTAPVAKGQFLWEAIAALPRWELKVQEPLGKPSACSDCCQRAGMGSLAGEAR